MNFFPTNVFSLIESCQLYIIEKYIKPATVAKQKQSSRGAIGSNHPEVQSEAIIPRYSKKKVLLKIMQNSQESAGARISFLIKL